MKHSDPDRPGWAAKFALLPNASWATIAAKESELERERMESQKSEHDHPSGQSSGATSKGS